MPRTPASDAFVDISVSPLDGAYDIALYLILDCGDSDATCVAGADIGVDGEDESVNRLYLFPGETVFAVVDSATFEAARYEMRVQSHPEEQLFATRNGTSVELRFAGATPPYRVLRDVAPDFSLPTVLSPSEPGPFFTDATAGLGSFFYQVD